MASQCTDSSEAAYHSKGGKLGSIRGWNFRPTPVRHQEKKKVCVCGVVVGCGGVEYQRQQQKTTNWTILE